MEPEFLSEKDMLSGGEDMLRNSFDAKESLLDDMNLDSFEMDDSVVGALIDSNESEPDDPILGSSIVSGKEGTPSKAEIDTLILDSIKSHGIGRDKPIDKKLLDDQRGVDVDNLVRNTLRVEYDSLSTYTPSLRGMLGD
jgi:hypothetical protein